MSLILLGYGTVPNLRYTYNEAGENSYGGSLGDGAYEYPNYHPPDYRPPAGEGNNFVNKSYGFYGSGFRGDGSGQGYDMFVGEHSAWA